MTRGDADPIIRELYVCRVMAKLSIAEVAKRARVARSTISDAENGQHTPNVAIVRRWANALSLDINLSVRGEEVVD